MAEIFLARDSRNGRFTVIKRILPFLLEEPEFVGMFLDEARIVSMLNHPNIVSLYELGQIKEGLYLAMEWVDGIDLRRLMQKEQERHSVIPVNAAAWAMARLCDGLFYAHNRAGPDGKPLGLIHRDISPQNVMVSFRGEVKLVDFGIAKANSWVSRSRPGVIKGKFLYLSPEQLAQEKLDHRSDIFALGSLMYELVTGKNPFIRSTTEAVIYAIRIEDAPLAHLQRPGIPVALSRIIAKCLQKDRRKRYQTAEEVKWALHGFMQKEAPMTSDEFAEYIEGTFGDDEERTSVYVPPNAQSGGGAPEPTRVGPKDETTVPVGRRPTPLSLLAIQAQLGAAPTEGTRPDRPNPRPSGPPPVPGAGELEEEPRTSPIAKPAPAPRRSGSKQPPPLALGASEVDDSVPIPTRNLRAPSNPLGPAFIPGDDDVGNSGIITNDERPNLRAGPTQSIDPEDFTATAPAPDPGQMEFSATQLPPVEDVEEPQEKRLVWLWVVIALMFIGGLAALGYSKFKTVPPVPAPGKPFLKPNPFVDGGRAGTPGVPVPAAVEDAAVVDAAVQDAGVDRTVDAGSFQAVDAAVVTSSIDAGIADAPDDSTDLTPLKPVMAKVFFKAPKGVTIEVKGKAVAPEKPLLFMPGTLAVTWKCPPAKKKGKPKVVKKNFTVPAPGAKPSIFELKCK